MDTAFQPDAFANDAFQIGSPVPSAGIDDDGVVTKRRRREEAEAEALRLEDEFWTVLT